MRATFEAMKMALADMPAINARLAFVLGLGVDD